MNKYKRIWQERKKCVQNHKGIKGKGIKEKVQTKRKEKGKTKIIYVDDSTEVTGLSL